MANEHIQEGDRVRLKSGGPAMTVTKLENDQKVWVQWFDQKQDLKSGVFPTHALEKYTSGPSFA